MTWGNSTIADTLVVLFVACKAAFIPRGCTLLSQGSFTFQSEEHPSRIPHTQEGTARPFNTLRRATSSEYPEGSGSALVVGTACTRFAHQARPTAAPARRTAAP